MSLNLSVATVLEKNRLDSGVPFLPLLKIDVVDPTTLAVVESLYLVRNNEPITYNGIVYTPTAFDVTLKKGLNEQASLTLSVNDYSQSVQAQMQAYGGGVGFHVTFSIIDSSALDLPAEMVEYFDVMSSSASEYACSFTLGVSNALTSAFPRRRQTRDFCQWRFKDPGTCGYTGAAPTCDLTLQGPNGCSVKGHTIHFGGFPGINSNGARYA